MANHGRVTTTSAMTPEMIDAILGEMNAAMFAGHLQVEYHKATEDDPGWGDHTWLLRYKSEDRVWFTKVCWLDGATLFEMRHGCGSQAEWWVDAAILNEVAVRLNGKITDDGIEDEWDGEPGKYATFLDYLKLSWQHLPKEPRLAVAGFEQDITPPELRDQLMIYGNVCA